MSRINLMDKVSRLRCVALLTALLLAGCSKPESAREAVERFVQQVLAGQTGEAYQAAAFAFQAEQSQRAFETASRDLGIIGATSSVVKEEEVVDKNARFEVEVTKQDGESLPLTVQLRQDGGRWLVHSLKSRRSTAVGMVENRFSLVGRGASFTDSLNRPVPDQETVQQLVQETMTQFNAALISGSFTEFYQVLSRAWQVQLTERQLQRAFQTFIDRKVDLTEAMKLEAVFEEQPKITTEGLLVISGHYPWSPFRVFFNLKYMHEQNQWKLFGIDVNLKN